jgi:hypothetical protein
VTACYFTHGDRLTENRQAHTVSLGKALLVSRLQVLLQSRRVHLPRTMEARVLAQQLLDDQVTALGLAALAAERAAPARVWLA